MWEFYIMPILRSALHDILQYAWRDLIAQAHDPQISWTKRFCHNWENILLYRVSQKEVPPTFENIIKKNLGVLWLKYWYGSKAYCVFGVLWKKMRLFENSNFRIWAIEYYSTLETFLSTTVHWNVHSLLTHLSIDWLQSRF